MKRPKMSFIILWRLNDWGLYKRRHEAFARELAKRDEVESVLHIEHISFKGLIYILYRWLKEKDRSLKKAYAEQFRKGFSWKPVAADAANKLYIYSMVSFYAGKGGVLKKCNDLAKRMQYKAINNHFRGSDAERVLIAYPPSQTVLEAVHYVKHDLLVADLVDDDIARTEDGKRKEELIAIYRALLPQCSWIFATSPSFNTNQYREYAGKNIDYLPNGVDPGDFSDNGNNGFQGRRKKIVCYVGIMNKEMDTELLEFVVSSNPDTRFILIGQATDELSVSIKALAGRYENLEYLGWKRHEDCIKFIETCDVLVNFKKNDATTAGGESIKTYEYLASGKPIVSTPVPPADRFSDIIYVAADKFEFSEQLRRALNEDSNELRRKRKSVAMENSWSRRIDVLIDAVTQSS